MSKLSAKDYSSMRAAGLALHRHGWSKVFTVEEMLNAWSALVNEVEGGYDDMVDEYTNDLTSRDWLAAALPMLTKPAQAAHQVTLDDLDHRFRAATLDDDGRAVGQFFHIDNKAGWWWRRVPTRHGGQFDVDETDE